MKIINNDCIAAMKEMPDNSVDSIVTDPPYELGFMGKSWDSSGIAFNVEVWQEALRVLKPGGHLIAFSGSRTYHRMAVAIEDAGFEIRDQIMWVYGSGFPKSHNVSKGIDKGIGENKNRQIQFVEWMRSTGITSKQINEATNTQMASHYIGFSQPAIAIADLFDLLRPFLPEVPEQIERLVAERTGIEWTAYKNRKVVGTKPSSLGGTVAAGERNQEIIDYHKNKIVDITAPATPAAQQWDGWGTALKPAHEPMVLARKPLIGTVANNVLTYGTGGLNIDGSRVGNEVLTNPPASASTNDSNSIGDGWRDDAKPTTATGRWPANFIHDGSDEVVALFPEAKGKVGMKILSDFTFSVGDKVDGAKFASQAGLGDSGSAARFFYCAKASKRDRNEGLDGFEVKRPDTRSTTGMGTFDEKGVAAQTNHHPTVKPTTLMQYLVRLVTPPNGTVLDPFMGSGSTGKACMYEGFDFIGIEMSAEYVEIAKARIEWAKNND